MDFSTLKGLTLATVSGMRRGSGEIVFTTTCGRSFRMQHHQSCCENVTVEDVVGDVEDITGTPILRAEERSSGANNRGSGIEQWTYYTIATINGTVDLRWHGTSNGYYSTDVSFDEIDSHVLAQSGMLPDGVYEVDTGDSIEWWLWDSESWRDFSGDVLTPSEAHYRFHVLGPALKRS